MAAELRSDGNVVFCRSWRSASAPGACQGFPAQARPSVAAKPSASHDVLRGPTAAQVFVAPVFCSGQFKQNLRQPKFIEFFLQRPHTLIFKLKKLSKSDVNFIYWCSVLADVPNAVALLNQQP